MKKESNLSRCWRAELDLICALAELGQGTTTIWKIKEAYVERGDITKEWQGWKDGELMFTSHSIPELKKLITQHEESVRCPKANNHQATSKTRKKK